MEATRPRHASAVIDAALLRVIGVRLSQPAPAGADRAVSSDPPRPRRPFGQHAGRRPRAATRRSRPARSTRTGVGLAAHRVPGEHGL